MIKASELRIGNVIWDDTHNKVKFVTHRVISDLASHAEPLPYSPVSLTPEWLEKCGGTKLPHSPFYEIDMPINIGQIHINPGNGMIWLKHHANESTALNPYSGNAGYYLHLLQNLFFALTGEELTIKL
jgi:hypothetical protein